MHNQDGTEAEHKTTRVWQTQERQLPKANGCACDDWTTRGPDSQIYMWVSVVETSPSPYEIKGNTQILQ